MIRENSLTSIQSLASQLADSGTRLVAIGNTPLSRAIKASLHPKAETSPNAIQSFDADLIEGSMAGDDITGKSHDQVVERDVGDAIKILGNVIAHSTNVVRPLAVEVSKYVSEEISKRILGYGRIEIKVCKPSPLYANPAFIGLIERYSNAVKMEYRFADAALPELNEEKLREIIVTGLSLDEDVTATINDIGGNALSNVYARLAGFTLDREFKYDDRAKALAYLLVRQLYENPPEGVSTDLASYNSVLSTALTQVGREAILCSETLDRHNRENRLVAEAPTHREKTIMVNGEVFKRFIAEGGSSEIIAAAFEGQYNTPLIYRSLLEHKDKLLAEWQRLESLKQHAANSQQVSIVNESIRDCIYKILKEQSKDTNKVDPNALRVATAEYLQKNRYTTNVDLFKYVRELICEVLFPDTNALYVLNTIDSIIEKDSSVEVREAAAIAFIDIASDWVTNQFVVEKD